ncbi:hypothetical protein N3K66_001264 [Trichothecium roseum]|uniref:Uncharacterized protein n=1 Tax=Trichothecium roseum TaxID=47278 RepID=A0ACC0VE87_9HYPO|nr:hypothetical protein N3K66_001264 [Trichothecium roseum]
MSEHENHTGSDSDELAQAHQTSEAQVHEVAGSPAVIPCSSVDDVDSDNVDLSLVPYREQHPQHAAAPTAAVTRSCRKDLDPNYYNDGLAGSEEDKDQGDDNMDDSDGSNYGENTKTKKRGGRPNKKGAKKNNKSSSATAAASSNATKATAATKATTAKRGKSRGRGGKAAQTAASHVASADAADADIDAADAATTSSGSKRKSPDQATISSKQAPAAKRVRDSPSDTATINNADADCAPPSDQEQHLQALRATVSTLQTVIVALQASVDGVQADLALKDQELSESRAAYDALSTTNAELHASMANMASISSSSSSRTCGGGSGTGARAQLSKRATQSDKQILNLLHDQKCDLEAECRSLRARVGSLVQEVLGDSLSYQQNSDPYIKQLWTLAQWTIRDGASQILNVLPQPDDIPPVPSGDGVDGRVRLLRHEEVLELAAKCRESPRKMRPLIETYLWQLALAQISVKGLWGGESGRDFTRFCKSLARASRGDVPKLQSYSNMKWRAAKELDAQYGVDAAVASAYIEDAAVSLEAFAPPEQRRNLRACLREVFDGLLELLVILHKSKAV